MKKNGFEIEEFNLPPAIRKRINELVELNLNPSTINLITAEFSSTSEEIKENIGRYIARMIEIETFQLTEQFNKDTKNNNFINLKQHLNIKNRQTNLLRIQQIFLKKDIEEQQGNLKNKTNVNAVESTINNIDFRKAMIVNNSLINESESAKNKLQELANKKRKIEMTIFDEKQKIVSAQKQYEKAKIEDDEITQDLKLNVIKFANRRLIEIAEAIKKYKTVNAIPEDLIMSLNDINNYENNQKNSNNFLNANTNHENNSENKEPTLEVDLETFFDVPGFDEEFERIFSQEPKIEHEKIKPISIKQGKIIKKETIVKPKIEAKSKIDVNKEEIEKPIIKQKLKVENAMSVEKLDNSSIKNYNSNDAEKIIKKIKKKSKAKDRQIEKIIREKEQIAKELNKLKQQNKIEELRKLENKKKESIAIAEKIMKKDKRIVNTSFQILEKKWKAQGINKQLFSKQKAFNAVNLLKEKQAQVELEKIDKIIDEKLEKTSEIIDNYNFIENNIIDPVKVDKVDLEKNVDDEMLLITEQLEEVIIDDEPDKNLKQSFSNVKQKIKFADNEEVNKDFDFETQKNKDEQRIIYLQRKKELSIISLEELNELKTKKKKHNQNSKKIDLSRYKLVIKQGH